MASFLTLDADYLLTDVADTDQSRRADIYDKYNKNKPGVRISFLGE